MIYWYEVVVMHVNNMIYSFVYRHQGELEELQNESAARKRKVKAARQDAIAQECFQHMEAFRAGTFGKRSLAYCA